MGKNKVRLSLFGTDYIITSDEEESYVRRIGDEVEKRITANMQQNTRISVLMSAVLTALDYCDEAKKANQSADNLRSQIKDYLEESAKARMEAGEARREIENMKREIQTLRMRLAEQDAPAGQLLPQQQLVHMSVKHIAVTQPLHGQAGAADGLPLRREDQGRLRLPLQASGPAAAGHRNMELLRSALPRVHSHGAHQGHVPHLPGIGKPLPAASWEQEHHRAAQGRC